MTTRIQQILFVLAIATLCQGCTLRNGRSTPTRKRVSNGVPGSYLFLTWWNPLGILM